MPRKMSVWANCSLKMSDLELGSWLLWGVLSVGNSLGVIGGEVDLLSGICLALLCACEPAWHGLWVYPPKHSCSFSALSWRQGKWSESAKSELSSHLRCGEEWGNLFMSYCFYSWLVYHLSFLLPAHCFSLQESFLLSYSLALTLGLQKHHVPSASPALCELLCSWRRYLDFIFVLCVAVLEIWGFGTP